jgi:hypothetical protein
LIDYVKKNVGIGKEQKNIDFEHSKIDVDKIFSNIKNHKDFGIGYSDLQ